MITMSVKIFFITICILQVTSVVRGGGALTRCLLPEFDDNEYENEYDYPTSDECTESAFMKFLMGTTEPPLPPCGKCTCLGNSKNLECKPILTHSDTEYDENTESALMQSLDIGITEPPLPPCGKCACLEGSKNLGRKPILEEMKSIVQDGAWMWRMASPKKKPNKK